MKGEVAAYITSVVGGIVGIVVVANMLGPAIEATNATGVAILAPAIVGTVLGAGLIMFILRTFF
jgi:hypothetical protein